MCDKEDYLTAYRVFFENFAATVNPEDQLPVNIAGYTITESELPGEVLYWSTQYLTEKQCPPTLMTPLRRIILDEVRAASKKTPNEFGYKSDESVYIALRLMQAMMARVNEICLRYLDNSRLDSLPPPPPPAQRDIKTVSCATKNSRRVMEDRHVEIGNLEALFGIETTEPTRFYAVYDGHAGSAAATYCAAHLHQYLVESPHYNTDLRKAMRDAFLRTDNDFIRKSHEERACGGSTAVVVTVRGRKLLAAWAGDSLALLAKRMRLMQLVRPHKPDRQDERDRIENSGGTVMFWGTWRVNGQLAVSRAIGDAQYKPYVTARPEIETVDLDGDEDFVVVACDGLWDFVSEDEVALTVYRQLATDPDDLKAVTKRLVCQAKRQGSADNISIIVVFLKDPRDIAADNSPPMDLGLDNALANAPPFVMETEACKRHDGADGDAAAAGADAILEADAIMADAIMAADNGVDNGVDNSDSDSEDLGPETAVDADDLDADRPHDPAPPTPPAHTVETNHVDGGLVDNVAESGEESEDEWNYFKGEGERRTETDEPPRSPTPCQDNSGCETSSVDMNSSPLNPDAPVFIPGTVAGSDVLLAESPRKPLPMDDIELPDVAQFQTEAVVRPAELLDLDNCDQLNGHHNVSVSEPGKEQLNGNESSAMDSLGFGFGVGDSDKTDTSLIHDFERIQKDTTDFCNIQVFQAHTETNPFASEGNEELLERLKNKERDPMSMSFYQEKDDDTCERLRSPTVDLNAVQLLPDSDEDEANEANETNEPNGFENDKENLRPTEPDNDAFPSTCQAPAPDNFMDFVATNNMHNYMEFEATAPQEVAQTDTPESHKLLFEQIPEIPDGKSSELGFVNEDLDRSESDVRAITPHDDQDVLSQDVDMESKPEASPVPTPTPRDVTSPQLTPDTNELDHKSPTPEPLLQIDNTNDIVKETEVETETRQTEVDDMFATHDEQTAAITPEHDVQENIVVDVHQEPSHADTQFDDKFNDDNVHENEFVSNDLLGLDTRVPQIEVSSSPQLVEAVTEPPVEAAPSPVPAESPAPLQSPVPPQSPEPPQSPAPSQSPLPTEPFPADVPASPIPVASPKPAASPAPVERPSSAASPAPAEIPLPRESPIPVEEAHYMQESMRPETASPVGASPLPAEGPSAASPEPAAPAPDIVPEESRAQEICLPVTSEIAQEDAPAAGTPPPTPAQGDVALSETPIAAPAAAAAAAVAVAAVAGATAVAAKKAATPAKKSPTTPKAAPGAKPAAKTGTATPRTPASAKKPATPASAAAKSAPAKTTPARTPGSATKAAAPAARAVPAKAPAAAKPAPKSAAPKPAAPTTTRTSTTRVTATKPAPTKEAPAAAKTAAPRAAPAARPAPKPAAPRPATAPASRPAASAPPAPRAAPRPATARPAAPRPAPARPAAPAERKPLTNGDAKAAPAAKPAPRAAPARPAPRTTTTAATATARSAAPKPAPRATAGTKPAPPKDADKQNKDLANKRITAKSAPPRTAATKAPVGGKPAPIKAPIKKPVVDATKKEMANGQTYGLTNGASEAIKPPPSPPPADNALLPDVIA